MAALNDIEVGETLKKLETELLRSEVRKDALRVSALLADEFREFGASGRVYTKAAVIAALKEEQPVAIALENFAFKELADGVALVTYRTAKTVEGVTSLALRSSVWVFREDRWQVLFHQGTKTQSARVVE